MDRKHKLEIVGITYNQIESGVYALILKEAEGTRRIPIIIGFPEAQAIECRLQKIDTPRPLTHDMTATIIRAFGIELKEVMIHQLPNGVFAADLVMTDGIRDIKIDARSSDAVAMAIRCGAPIYCTEEVMRNASFDQQTPAKEPAAPAQPQARQNASELVHMTEEELQKAMSAAVAEENYEEAARIKAELDRRKE